MGFLVDAVVGCGPSFTGTPILQLLYNHPYLSIESVLNLKLLLSYPHHATIHQAEHMINDRIWCT